jgi:hypothetical protein
MPHTVQNNILHDHIHDLLDIVLHGTTRASNTESPPALSRPEAVADPRMDQKEGLLRLSMFGEGTRGDVTALRLSATFNATAPSPLRRGPLRAQRLTLESPYALQP